MHVSVLCCKIINQTKYVKYSFKRSQCVSSVCMRIRSISWQSSSIMDGSCHQSLASINKPVASQSCAPTPICYQFGQDLIPIHSHRFLSGPGLISQRPQANGCWLAPSGKRGTVIIITMKTSTLNINSCDRVPRKTCCEMRFLLFWHTQLKEWVL